MGQLILAERSLIAMVVALMAGYAMARQVRYMLHEGIGVDTGGGWTAMFICEFIVASAGLGVAFF